MRIIVIDLDGTLCNSSHRDHLAVAGQWDEFHSALTDDHPWPDVAALVEAFTDSMADAERHQVIAITGRNERYRYKTLGWLGLHQIHLDDLLMRRDDDFRSDTIVKPDLLFGYLESNSQAREDVLMILEDRDKMVEAWRNLGFRCWQVQPGGY